MADSNGNDVTLPEQAAGSDSGSNTAGIDQSYNDFLTRLLQALTDNQNRIFRELDAKLEAQAIAREERAAREKKLAAEREAQAAARDKERAAREKELAAEREAQATAREEERAARDKERAAREKELAAEREAQATAREEERAARDKERAARQEAQTAALKKLYEERELMLRNIPSSSESSLQAPVESIAHPHAEASIPFDYSSSLTNPNHAAYKALSEMYACTFAPDSLPSIIAQLGGDWSAEWQKALDGKGIFAEDNIWSIISIGSRTYDAGQGATRSNLKGLYLNILNALMLDIEESLQRRRICLNSRWSYSHKTSAKDKHMPNGFLHVCGPGIIPNWRSAVVAFELESDMCKQDDTNILGRLLWSFIAMAKNQPRRFTLGFSESQNGELYVYLCTTEKVCYTYIGVLPYCTEDRSQVTKAVRFLLLVYMQLSKDTGILMHKDSNMSGSFRAQDIVNGRSIDLVSDLSDMDITILNGKARSGRHRALFGPRSWIFDASIKSATAAANHILKLHWHDNSSEVAVHAKVTEFKVPHTPQLVGAIAIPARDGGSVAGEMLLLEDVGKDIYTFFNKLQSANSHQMTDMFAGYFHALLAAATGDGGKFVLHRDVSARNLLVKNTRPFLIDWGCGIVADTDRPRYAPKYSMVGTMPFMGLRVLFECSNRSLIDDLESLFIVFAYCLWLKYGTIPADDNKYWDGTATTDELLNFRTRWLQCEDSFIKRMKLNGCPEELRNLATAMYGLVYPLSKVPLYNICEDVTDPRLAIFNAHEWVAAFDTTAASSKSANITCVNLELLREYVKNTPECNALLIDSVLSQPGLKAKRSDLDDVSTQPKRSRM